MTDELGASLESIRQTPFGRFRVQFLNYSTPPMRYGFHLGNALFHLRSTIYVRWMDRRWDGL